MIMPSVLGQVAAAGDSAFDLCRQPQKAESEPGTGPLDTDLYRKAPASRDRPPFPCRCHASAQSGPKPNGSEVDAIPDRDIATCRGREVLDAAGRSEERRVGKHCGARRPRRVRCDVDAW